MSTTEKAAAARLAGARGKSAPPMDSQTREGNYRRQTGRSPKRAHREPTSRWWWLRDDLTPKQRSRVRHKLNRERLREAERGGRG